MIGPVQSTVHHPLFARFFSWVVSPLLEHELAGLRAQLLEGLHGRVLEIGAGGGPNFAHYPASVDEVVAYEPEPYLRERALRSAAAAPLRVSVRAGRAERLAETDASFDAAVAGLVLCSVEDQRAAVEELRRVLVPGGELRFLEHVRHRQPRRRLAQAALDRSGIWPLAGGGCHCARDTAATIEAGGFQLQTVRELTLGPAWSPANPFLLGTARAPAASGR